MHCAGVAYADVRAGLIGLQIKKFEKLDELILEIDALDSKSIQVNQRKRGLIKQLAHLKDLDADEIKKKEYVGKINDCVDSILCDSTDEEFHQLSMEAQACGDEILQLYGDDVVALDDQTSLFLSIFSALKNIVLPIIRPCSSDPKQLLQEMQGHDRRVKEFENLLDTEELHLSFGNQSDYMHWMKFHAREECERVINRWGLHLSNFSCQTSEHFNKILKRLVERLHGFTSRSVSNKQGLEWKNKFGLIMQQFQIRYFHFYGTLSSLSTQKCGLCGKSGHNRRSKLCAQYT